MAEVKSSTGVKDYHLVDVKTHSHSAQGCFRQSTGRMVVKRFLVDVFKD
jgi:hypothetical protein